MPFEPGSVIAGKYRVERMLGEGGMGIVLAARHLGLDEMVAVKLIKEERAKGTDALARFQREARAAARIKSEHVARVLDVDRLPEGDPYIVMELIDGVDLHALVNRRQTLPPGEAAQYIVQACEGLAEAHALGMVHRDLKLKNLFLTQRRDGRALIKVIDFGVVKLSQIAEDAPSTDTEVGRRSARDATITSGAMLVGSVHYMAPEQIRASNIVDAQADVWSLGVCLYVMLTGQLPFDGHTVAEVCAQIQGRPPRDVRDHVPHIPAELAAVVTKTLEKDMRRRWGSVAALAKALAPFHADTAAEGRITTILESSSQTRDRAIVVPSSSDDVNGETRDMTNAFHGRVSSTIDAAAVGSLATKPPGPTRRAPLVAGTLTLIAAAAVTVFVWSKRPPPAVAPEPPPPTVAAAAAPPSVVPPPAVSSAMPAPDPIPSAAPAPVKTAGSKPHPKTKPSPAPKPADPKPEAPNAYDKF